MPIVEVDGQEIEFPDDMGQDQIKEVLRQKFPPQQPLAPKMGKITAGARGLEEMTSFGLTDELRGFGRALGSKVRGDERPFNQLLDRGIGEVREEYAKAKQDQPGATLTGEVLGAVIPAFTPGGQAIAARLGAGNLGARIAKTAGAGATSMGAYGFGSGEGNAIERLPRTAGHAALGAVAGGAVPAAGAGLTKLNTKTIIPNSDTIRAKAGQLYQLAEKHGGSLKPEFTNNFLAKAQKSLLSDDAIINAMKSNKPLADAFDDLSAFQNQPMTLSRAQALDEQLGLMIDGFVDNTGKMSKAGNKLLEVQRTLRNMIENADDALLSGTKEGFEALKEGRKLWAVSRRLNDVERIIENAENFQVPATAIKVGFRRLLNSSKILGYSPEEVKAISRAAKTGVVSDVMATFGSRLTGLFGMTHGPGGAALGYAASTAARAGATASQIGRAEKVAKEVARKSGLATTEKRIKLPLKDLMKLPPKQAKAILQQAEAQKLLPPPAREFVTDWDGVTRLATPEEQAAAQTARMRAEQLGLTPDVVRAQNLAEMQRLMENFGQSSLGREMLKNPNRPVSTLKKN